MSVTLGSINISITKRFEILKKILSIIDAYTFGDTENENVKYAIDTIKDADLTYRTKAIKYIQKYMEDQSCQKNYNDYNVFLTSENIEGLLNTFYTFFKDLNKEYVIDDLEMLLDKYKSQTIHMAPIAIKLNNVSHCSCGAAFILEEKTSEKICKKCGCSEKIYGIAFDDDFCMGNDRGKHGKYEPIKHCEDWLIRIQGKESQDSVPEEVIEKVKAAFKGYNLLWLDAKKVRECLKSIKETKYNDHIPLIIKLVTERNVPQYTEPEIKEIKKHFANCIQIYHKLMQRSNAIYYPYVIYKITDNVLKNSERKKGILSNIHLQTRDTLISNDRTWAAICAESKNFEYKPTVSDD